MVNNPSAGRPSWTREVLQKRARELARSLGQSQEQTDSLEIIAFTLGKESFAIELTYLREVQPLADLNWSLVPCTPQFVVGVVNLRGRLYSMMDLAAFLGLRNRQVGPESHVLLVRGETRGKGPAMDLGLISDTLPEIRRLNPRDLQEPQGTVSPQAQKYFKGVSAYMTTLLDINTLLADPAILVG